MVSDAPADEYILCVVAHSDDQAIGPGGALLKYANEDKKVITVVFSFGEKSHPHFKKDIIQQIRVKESEKADKLLGGEGVEFFGLTEGKFRQEFYEQGYDQKLSFLMEHYRPTHIFTHADDDSHPDHKAVHDIVLDVYDKAKPQGTAVYTFGVWRLFRFTSRKKPVLVVDISKYFRRKLQVVRSFKSQWIAVLVLSASIYLKAIASGFKYGYEFAEVFYKVR